MARRIGVGSTDEDIFDRSRRIGWLDLDSVSKTRVLMVGAGAIGNEVAKDLVLSGFRKVTIVDMDRVVGSNLNRCLFFSREDASEGRMKAEVVASGMVDLANDVKIDPVIGRIQDQPGTIFTEHDVIMGCLDNLEARIHTNAYAYASGRAYIDGGMEGFLGKVMVVKPPDGPCLQCGMNRTHAKIASMRFSCTGKDVVFFEPKLAAEITTTSVVSAVMVREALKVASGHPEMLLRNSFYYDGERNVFEEMEIALDPECPVHAVRRGTTGNRKRFKSK